MGESHKIHNSILDNEISKKNSISPLVLIIMVFFFWGFVAASNTILIPVFKAKFKLSQFQSQLIEFAFYIAYFVGGLIYFLWSVFFGDPLNRIGYKNGLILGLVLSAIGTLIFIPAANNASYILFLLGYFVIAFGFSLQQIVANPYVLALGKPNTGAHRVSLAGGINSFGTAIGPLLIAFAIFGTLSSKSDALNLENVKIPYLILGLAFILVAAILYLSKLPTIKNNEKTSLDWGVFKFPQLWLGMLAIFMYVGTEVTIQSNLNVAMLSPATLGYTKEQSVHFISLYWGCLMMGRWAGALGAFELKKTLRLSLSIFTPIIAFGVIVLVNYIKIGKYQLSFFQISEMRELLNFFPFVIFSILMNLIVGKKPARTMLVFGICAAICMVLGMFNAGILSIYFFIAGGLFCSVMWPCIFSLTLAGLGKYTNQASSFLIMMILGGAILPLLQGFYIDTTHEILKSYFIPLVGFVYLAFFGFVIKRILLKRNINFDAEEQ